MPLTPEQIKLLLAVPEKKKSAGRKSKNYIDTSVRDIATWFKLHHKLQDLDTYELAKCSNPNCTDTRERQAVAVINGQDMCRRCFLDGWLSEIDGQVSLDDTSE